MKYLLCLRCREAWNAVTFEACAACPTADRVLDVNPFADGDRAAWLTARLRGERGRAAMAWAEFAGHGMLMLALEQRIRDRGNTAVRWH